MLTLQAASTMLLATWGVSMVVATLFYRWIESPAASQRITAGLRRLAGRST